MADNEALSTTLSKLDKYLQQREEGVLDYLARAKREQEALKRFERGLPKLKEWLRAHWDDLEEQTKASGYAKQLPTLGEAPYVTRNYSTEQVVYLKALKGIRRAEEQLVRLNALPDSDPAAIKRTQSRLDKYIKERDALITVITGGPAKKKDKVKFKGFIDSFPLSELITIGADGGYSYNVSPRFVLPREMQYYFNDLFHSKAMQERVNNLIKEQANDNSEA